MTEVAEVIRIEKDDGEILRFSELMPFLQATDWKDNWPIV